MVSTKIIIRLDKKNAKNEAPLYLRVTAGRKSNYTGLGISVNVDYWDAATMQVKRGHQNMQRINNFLTAKLSEAQAMSLEVQAKDEKVSPNKIKNSILGHTGVDFLAYFNTYNNRLLKRDKINTHRRANSVYNKIKGYMDEVMPGKVLYFEDITVKWLKDYEFYLTSEKENAINTVYTEMKGIRRLINEAISEDIIKPEKSPFLKYKLKWEQVEKNYLTEDELSAIENLVLPAEQCISVHRDVFILPTYAAGLRVSDILQLRWRNYDGEKLNLQTQKTGSVVSIKLPSKAIEVINKYKTELITPDGFIFPILSKFIIDSEKSRVQAISCATSYINKDLRKIAKLAEITKHIHFHTSRHTWATRALKKGMRIEYVSKLMGHASIKTTQVYAKIVNEELDKAMDVFNEPGQLYTLKTA